MKTAFAVIAGTILGLVIVFLFIAFFTWILVMNLTDIQNVGFNFWNVFWIALALVGLVGGGSKAGNS